jgi:hypothetical protein
LRINWDELKRENYINKEEDLSEMVDDCIGFIRIGEICVDVIIRCYGDTDNPEYVYSYDFYVANEDTGYAYKEEMNNLPYDYADGVDLKALAFSYDEFVEKSENMITMFIERNDKSNGYSLVEKANKPLLIW